MNTRLEPPTVELPPDIELRVRHRILRATRTPPRRSRRWLPAVASAAAVATVVAAIAVATDRTRSVSDPPAAGTDVQSLDAGPVTGPERDTAVGACRKTLPHAADAQVRFVRRVVGDPVHSRPGVTGIVVVLRADDGTDIVCGPQLDRWPGLVAAERGKPAPGPTLAQPLVPVARVPYTISSGWSFVAAIYQVHPSIARLESRVRLYGRTGDWYRAALVDGIAYAGGFGDGMLTPTPGQRPPPSKPSAGPLTFTQEQRPPRLVEHRAFDAQGNPIPLPVSGW